MHVDLLDSRRLGCKTRVHCASSCFLRGICCKRVNRQGNSDNSDNCRQGPIGREHWMLRHVMTSSRAEPLDTAPHTHGNLRASVRKCTNYAVAGAIFVAIPRRTANVEM